MKNVIKIAGVSFVIFSAATIIVKVLEVNEYIGYGMGSAALAIFLISKKKRQSSEK
jgi:hypothetical protein